MKYLGIYLQLSVIVGFLWVAVDELRQTRRVLVRIEHAIHEEAMR